MKSPRVSYKMGDNSIYCTVNKSSNALANLISLHNVAFHWLSSDFMQLSLYIGTACNIFTAILKENVTSALEWG